MPVALLRGDGVPGFAPVARPRFLLGADLDCDLVDESPGVEAQHATLRYRRGEYLLKAEEGCSVWVGGQRVPLISLRDGDAVSLAPDALPWRFRSRVEGSFWPPELHLGEAWLSHPEFGNAEHGPLRFGDGPPVGGSDPMRCRLVSTAHGPWIVKLLGPVGKPADANGYLRFLAAVGGAPHPALASLVDGGLAPHRDTPWRWMATRRVDGDCAGDHVASDRLPARRVLQVLACLADGLRILHHRGVVHGDVAPENVILSPRCPGVLIDYGRAVSLENPLPTGHDTPDASGYAAPELATNGVDALSPPVDVYGLAAVGFALLTGAPPSGEESRAALEHARAEEPERWRLDGDAAGILVSVVAEGLEADPADRPDAVACARTLAFAEAHAGVGGVLDGTAPAPEGPTPDECRRPARA